jgi:hypothetical protein
LSTTPENTSAEFRHSMTLRFENDPLQRRQALAKLRHQSAASTQREDDKSWGALSLPRVSARRSVIAGNWRRSRDW